MANVLCVDDEADILDLLDGALTHRGHRVLQARRLSHATAHVRAGRVDALIVDGLLPDGNGLEWIAQMRDEGFEGPVILFTAFHTDLHSRASMADCRVGLYVNKRNMDLAYALEQMHRAIAGMDVGACCPGRQEI